MENKDLDDYLDGCWPNNDQQNTPSLQPKVECQSDYADIEEPKHSDAIPFKNPISVADNYLNKFYLQKLSSLKIFEYKDEDYPRLPSMSWYLIDSVVYEKGVFFVDKLSMLYGALNNVARQVALVIKKTKDGVIRLYIGARDIDDPYATSGLIMKDSLRGLFPGIKVKKIKNNDNTFEKSLIGRYSPCVASVSGVASLRDDKKESFIQGVERIVNGAKNISQFTAFFIADSINANETRKIIDGFESLYTDLTPLAKGQVTYSYGVNTTNTEGISDGFSESIGKSIGKTITNGTSIAKSQNQQHTHTESDGKTESDNVGAYAGGSFAGFGAGVSYSHGWGESHQVGESRMEGTGIVNTINDLIGDTSMDQNVKTKIKTYLKQLSEGYSENKSSMCYVENKHVSRLLESIDVQLKRLKNAAPFGLWNHATYFIADNESTSTELANIYKGCVVGEESNIEVTAINSWKKCDSNKLMEYINRTLHPRFIVDNNYVTPGSIVSSKELAIHMSLPQSSLPGVMVQHKASFGRNVMSCVDSKNSVEIGEIFHLGESDKTKVNIDVDTLTRHAFVTGTTGSGKSNTIYHLVNSIVKDGSDKKVLIIEPVKGEYKNVFIEFEVYGTNPKLTKLLKINPFKFQKDKIRVDEHVDRLVEIFNVCWPMYAAMPAVLKDSILKAYEACGWNLRKSENKYDLYPSFRDVIEQLKVIINSSSYSKDTKGDYIGSIETRLRSLTNGINGEIFVSNNDIDDEKLFEENVIVDLSRIGSVETRSLIMGILILKLSEYRMANEQNSNGKLKHITVLEEAHNILKRTSKQQSQESANLVGKSVEMIANAIAEMRSYGEGFIIADQSPTSVDDAAIKNTNTKIIMSLPDGDDRLIAGKSVGLDEDQIDEIAKLPTGVAVVYQNNWDEAVLCKIVKHNVDGKKYNYEVDDDNKPQKLNSKVVSFLTEPKELEDVEKNEIKNDILTRDMLSLYKYELFSIIDDKKSLNSGNTFPLRSRILLEYSGLFDDISNLNIMNLTTKCMDEKCRELVVEKISPEQTNIGYIRKIIHELLFGASLIDNSIKANLENWKNYARCK